jgi:multiple sugar transport system permease protein
MREHQLQPRGEHAIVPLASPSWIRRLIRVLGKLRQPQREPERVFGALFVLPALALVVVFRMVPLIWGGYYSMTDFDGVHPARFIGLANYANLFSDSTFGASMKNAAILLATLPVWIALPLVLATLIHQGVPGGGFFRAVYFLPAVLSSVIIGVIFNFVLNYAGALNNLTALLGIDPVDWLGNGGTALMSLIAIQLWSSFGMSVLIFLSGLATVAPELIEAARLDGATPVQVFRYVILPAIRPIIEFALVVTCIGMLTSMFGLIYVMTAGGPGTSTYLPEYLIWIEQGYLNKPGYASAISMVLFALMAGLAVVQIRIMSRNAGV